MKNRFKEWNLRRVLTLVTIGVLMVCVAMSIVSSAMRSATQAVMQNPEAYAAFVHKLARVSFDECRNDLQCHERWAKEDLPSFLPENRGYSPDDRVTIQRDVWAITSGQAAREQIDRMFPKELADALMNANSPNQ